MRNSKEIIQVSAVSIGQKSKIFYGWWIVFACSIISLYTSSVVFFGFTAFFEPLLKEFGWSYTQISFASSLRGMEVGLFGPVIGFLVDRYGSRKIMVLGVIVTGFGLLLLSRTGSLMTFYAAFLFLSLGAGSTHSVTSMSAVANWFKKNVGKALGVMSVGFGASGLLVPVIVWLIASYGWRSALVILGIGMWVVGIPLACIIRNNPEDYGYLPDGLAAEEVSVQEIAKGTKNKEIEMSFSEVMKKKSFWLINIGEAIRNVSLAAVVIHVMPYLNILGASRTKAALVAAAIPLVSIPGRFGFGWLGDIFEVRYVMTLAYGFMGLGLLAFCYAESTFGIVLFLILFSIGFGGNQVLRGAILRKYYGRKSFGKLMGIVIGCAAVGGVVGPTLAGWTFDRQGSYGVIWPGLAVSIGVAMILQLLAKPDGSKS